MDLCAKRAAIRAGYSPKTAENQGSRLLRNAQVRAAVALGAARQQERTGITADRVLAELFSIGTSDIGLAYDDEGRLKALTDIPEHLGRAIAGIDIETRRDVSDATVGGSERVTVKRLRLWDKVAALEKLGRYLKLFTERVEVTGHGDLAERLERAQARLSGRRS